MINWEGTRTCTYTRALRLPEWIGLGADSVKKAPCRIILLSCCEKLTVKTNKKHCSPYTKNTRPNMCRQLLPFFGPQLEKLLFYFMLIKDIRYKRVNKIGSHGLNSMPFFSLLRGVCLGSLGPLQPGLWRGEQGEKPGGDHAGRGGGGQVPQPHRDTVLQRANLWNNR